MALSCRSSFFCSIKQIELCFIFSFNHHLFAANDVKTFGQAFSAEGATYQLTLHVVDASRCDLLYVALGYIGNTGVDLVLTVVEQVEVVNEWHLTVLLRQLNAEADLNITSFFEFEGNVRMIIVGTFQHVVNQ